MKILTKIHLQRCVCVHVSVCAVDCGILVKVRHTYGAEI